jgi:protein involved in polysaccharide export with SLBB domain
MGGMGGPPAAQVPLPGESERSLAFSNPVELQIDAKVSAATKPITNIQPLDVLQIRTVGTIIDQPIDGFYLVEPDGNVALGPAYGRANVNGLTMEQAEEKVAQQLKEVLAKPEVQVTVARRLNRWRRATYPRLPYTINTYDVLNVRVVGTILDQPIDGVYLVEPAGTVPLGPVYGRAQVGGLTIEAAEKAIRKKLEQVLQKPDVQVTLPIAGNTSAVQWQEVAMPKSPCTIQAGDLLSIDAIGTILDQPIQGVYLVEPSGTVALGPAYGRAKVEALTLEEAEKVIQKKLQEVLANPAVSVTLAGWVDETSNLTPGTRRADPSPHRAPPYTYKRSSPQPEMGELDPVKPKKPQEPLLMTYEIDPKSLPAGTTAPDMDKLVDVIDRRINVGREVIAHVGKRLDGRIVIRLNRPDDANQKRIERLLARPGTLELRILANTRDNKAVIEQAQKDESKTEVFDASGKRTAWWVPVKADQEKSLVHNLNIVLRTRKLENRGVTEVLVVPDAHNVTGAYLTRTKIGFDRRGQPSIDLTFNEEGGKLLGKLTDEHLPDKATGFACKLGIILDGELWSAPSLQSKITDRAQVTGVFTKEELADLVDVLNGGMLPVRLRLMPTDSSSK